MNLSYAMYIILYLQVALVWCCLEPEWPPWIQRAVPPRQALFRYHLPRIHSRGKLFSFFLSMFSFFFYTKNFYSEKRKEYVKQTDSLETLKSKKYMYVCCLTDRQTYKIYCLLIGIENLNKQKHSSILDSCRK